MANSDPVGSLMRGIDILKLIGDAENGLKICEIAVALNLKQPTCYNLVRTLVMCGFVEKRNNRLYLGQDLIQLTKKHSNSAFLPEWKRNCSRCISGFPAVRWCLPCRVRRECCRRTGSPLSVRA